MLFTRRHLLLAPSGIAAASAFGGLARRASAAGVNETALDTKFQVAFIGSWFDPPKAKETAFAQIDAGVDVMYAERFGISDAAKERKVPAVSNVIDTQADYP